MENQAAQVLQNGRNAGLIKSFDKHAMAPRIESVYISFAQFGVPGLGTDLYFSPNPKLDQGNCIIVGLSVIDTTTVSNFPNPPATDGLSTADLAKFMFVASNNMREQIFSVPLPILLKRTNTGKICQVHLENQIWQNCYIQCVNTSGISSTMGVYLQVHYIPFGE
jgi:hypothetical protein